LKTDFTIQYFQHSMETLPTCFMCHPIQVVSKGNIITKVFNLDPPTLTF